jgi:hypothetical protein
VTWIDGAGYVVSPLDDVNGVRRSQKRAVHSMSAIPGYGRVLQSSEMTRGAVNGSFAHSDRHQGTMLTPEQQVEDTRRRMPRKTARFIRTFLLYTAGLLVAVVTAGLGFRAYLQHRAAEELAIRSPNGVQEGGFVAIGA